MKNQEVICIIQAGLAWANWTEEQREAFVICRASDKSKYLKSHKN